MWAKIKIGARWVYDWITIIAAALVGVPAVLLDLLNYFSVVDISPLVGSDKALKIVTGVAIIKALLAFIASRIKAD